MVTASSRGQNESLAPSSLSSSCTTLGQSVELNPLLAGLSQPEIPSLFGLRGAAALAVVFYHYLQHWKPAAFFPGPYAVTLFFELSGLLITWLLLSEIDRSGAVDTRQFYLRRAVRLFPVFYVVWGLCRMAGPFAGSTATFLYLGDYYHALTQRYNILTVAWSLGVEEKFYLLWPFLLSRFEKAKLIKISFAILIAEPIYRSTLSALGFRAYTWFAFDTHLDAIVLGCLIALLAKGGWSPPAWLSHPLTPVWALVLVFALQSQSDLVTYLLAVILLAVICRPTRLLNNPVAKYLGAISYSLYLCHVYARDVLWERMTGGTHYLSNPAAVFVFQVALAIALASLLHFAVERPFLMLKHSLHTQQNTTNAAKRCSQPRV
jgi:peptidoglycan/LPS O-acetylase OafA/YrhL